MRAVMYNCSVPYENWKDVSYILNINLQHDSIKEPRCKVLQCHFSANMHYAQDYLFRRLFIDKIDRLFKQRMGANYMSLYDTFGWMQTIDFREECNMA